MNRRDHLKLVVELQRRELLKHRKLDEVQRKLRSHLRNPMRRKRRNGEF